jgi:hypothetical protein
MAKEQKQAVRELIEEVKRFHRDGGGDGYSERLERLILRSPTTRGLVHDVLNLADKVDIVDAMKDLEVVRRILVGRFERQTGKGQSHE